MAAAITAEGVLHLEYMGPQAAFSIDSSTGAFCESSFSSALGLTDSSFCTSDTQKQEKTLVMTAHNIPYSHPAEIIEVYKQMNYKGCKTGVGGLGLGGCSPLITL